MNTRFHQILVSLIACFFASTALAQGVLPTHPVPGQVAPDIFATELQNAPDWMKPGEINLAELQGKVVYVKFWTTGCMPCIQAMPKHNELKAKYGDKLVIIGVTPQSLEDIADFLSSRETSMIVLSDPDSTTWFRYYPPGLGSGTLICPNGRVSQVSVNDLELDEAMIEMALRNEYEDGPPIDMNGEILPHAQALGSDWGLPRSEQDGIYGQDPYSLAQEATFQIICRPSWSNGKFQGGGTLGKMAWISSRASSIISSNVPVVGFEGLGAHTPQHRIDGPDWLDERYFDFIFHMPGITDAQQRELIKTAIEVGMSIDIDREIREVDGYRLEWVDPSNTLPQSEKPYSQWLGGEKLDDGRHSTIVTVPAHEGFGSTNLMSFAINNRLVDDA